MITVVGLGSLGSKTVIALLKLGIKQLQIVDFDIVEAKNIGSQILYDESQVGLNKTLAAKQTISQKFPEVKIIEFQSKFELNSDLGLFKFSELLLDCTDNLQTRLDIDMVAFTAKKPWIYAGIKGNAGQVMFFDYKNLNLNNPQFKTVFGSFISGVEAVNNPETTTQIAQIQAELAIEYLAYGQIKSSNLVIVKPGKVLRLRV